MSAFEGHGWAVVQCKFLETKEDIGPTNASLHIGQLPGRKQVCLYGQNGKLAVINVYAYFPTHEKAQEALAILDRLMGAKS